MKKIIWILFLIIFLSLATEADFSLAQQDTVEIYFFYNAVCSHCKAEKEFLEALKAKYPEVEVKAYEIVDHPENKEILKSFYEKYQVPKKDWGRVPATFTSTRYFIGFSQQIGREIEGCIKECLGDGGSTSKTIEIPFFGEVDISKISLPVLTIILGALDGLNPCAMWILMFLITLLINTRSRKRMWLIGGTFVLASGVVYFLILSAWFNFFEAISYVNITRKLIGILAIGVGIWQIRNFLTYHPGVCKVLGWQSRLETSLKERAERIVASPLTFAMIGGLIVLALGVNLVEFACSAGLPAIFTQVLALSELSRFSYYFYLLLYTFVFMLDDLILLLLAIITLNKIGFTEKYNYWATLIGGLLIFALGTLLIFKPEILMFG